MDDLKPSPGPVMLDIVGLTVTDDDARRIAHPLTGGVILFARNYQDRAQLSALTEHIRGLRDDIIIAVDHEGGRVQRFRGDGFTALPPMRRLGELWDADVLRATQLATSIGYVIACELRASGVDLSFTPVLDLDYGVSKAIGDRALHRDPRVVTLLAKSLNHGLALAGMANCGKHFPGHGYVEADSHLAIPVDTRTLEQILGEDAQPYSWLGLSLSAVMPAHVIYPAVDSRPAGFSKIWLQKILRRQLGFEGLIFSDDLSMEGARFAGDMVQAAQAALEAGCDMVLVCNQPAQADAVLAGLKPPRSKAAQQRIKQLTARGRSPRWGKLERQPSYLSAVKQIQEVFGE